MNNAINQTATQHTQLLKPYKQGQRFIATLLLFSLLLQSCGGSHGLSVTNDRDRKGNLIQHNFHPEAATQQRDNPALTKEARQESSRSLEPLRGRSVQEEGSRTRKALDTVKKDPTICSAQNTTSPSKNTQKTTKTAPLSRGMGRYWKPAVLLAVVAAGTSQLSGQVASTGYGLFKQFDSMLTFPQVSGFPAGVATDSPTVGPTFSPTSSPTYVPTTKTESPTNTPSSAPSSSPTFAPTTQTDVPSLPPTTQRHSPTSSPSFVPTSSPTYAPTTQTEAPSSLPTYAPTTKTESPTNRPSASPSPKLEEIDSYWLSQWNITQIDHSMDTQIYINVGDDGALYVLGANRTRVVKKPSPIDNILLLKFSPNGVFDWGKALHYPTDSHPTAFTSGKDGSLYAAVSTSREPDTKNGVFH